MVHQRLQRHCMYASAQEIVFYSAEVNWCGNLCSASGMRHDPTRICELHLSTVLKPAANCSVYRMKTHLPDLAERASSFCDFLTLQIIPDNVPIVFRVKIVVRTLFLRFSKSQVGAFPCFGVSVKVVLGLHSITRFTKPPRLNKQPEHLDKVKYIWHFIRHDLWVQSW